jgi:hypothetical protein
MAIRSPAAAAGLFMVITLMLLWPGRALADVIDGDWCYPDGRRFSIRGPDILTPGAEHVRGIYARHSFSYVIPPAERPAGGTIHMILVNENTIHLRTGSDPTDDGRMPEVWHRCIPAVSDVGGSAGSGTLTYSASPA